MSGEMNPLMKLLESSRASGAGHSPRGGYEGDGNGRAPEPSPSKPLSSPPGIIEMSPGIATPSVGHRPSFAPPPGPPPPSPAPGQAATPHSLAQLFAQFSQQANQAAERSPSPPSPVPPTSSGTAVTSGSGPSSVQTENRASFTDARSQDTARERPGTEIHGRYTVYDQRLDGDGNSRPLQVSPITLYKSENDGRIIAVNDNFICYTIRGALLRVINLHTADRLLLQGHQERVIDMAFVSREVDILASLDAKGTVIVWKIVAREENNLDFELIKSFSPPAQRILWHPKNKNILAVVRGSTVGIVDLERVENEPRTQQIDYIALYSGHSGAIIDFCFSPSGEHLATASADGTVRLWHSVPTSSTATVHITESVRAFEPFGGRPVDSVFFLGVKQGGKDLGLLTGGDNNTELRIWPAPLQSGPDGPTCVQTLKIRRREGGGKNFIVADVTRTYFFLSNTQGKVLFVAHIAAAGESDDEYRFDNITEFTLVEPVLSSFVLNETIQSQEGSPPPLSGDFQMDYYCVQTSAVQRYQLVASQAYLPPAPSAPEKGERRASTPSRSTPPLSSPASTAQVRSPSGSPTARNGSSTARLSLKPSSASTVAEPSGSPRFLVPSSASSLSYRSRSASGSLTAASPTADIAADVVESALSDQPVGANTTEEKQATAEESEEPSGDFPADQAASEREVPALLKTEMATVPNAGIHRPQRHGRSNSDTWREPGRLSAYRPSDGPSTQDLDQLYTRLESLINFRQAEWEAREEELINKVTKAVEDQLPLLLEEMLQKQVHQVLVPGMGRTVVHTMDQFLKPVQLSFKKILTEKLPPVIEKRFNDMVNETMAQQVEGKMEQLVVDIKEQVREPVQQSFRECFQEAIIPSFQAATQKMFEQINETFIRGISQTAFLAENNGQLARLHSQLDSLTKSVATLTAKVEELSSQPKAAVGEDSERLSHGLYRTPSGRVMEPQDELKFLISDKKYEEALSQALSATDVGLVTWTVSRMDIDDVITCQPPAVSQMVMLCLVQQLGSNLSHETKLKLDWVRECLMALNPKDPAIAPHVESVVEQLRTNLKALEGETLRTGRKELNHQIKLVLHIALSIQSIL